MFAATSCGILLLHPDVGTRRHAGGVQLLLHHQRSLQARCATGAVSNMATIHSSSIDCDHCWNEKTSLGRMRSRCSGILRCGTLHRIDTVLSHAAVALLG
jgi:hypothetical protein